MPLIMRSPRLGGLDDDPICIGERWKQDAQLRGVKNALMVVTFGACVPAFDSRVHPFEVYSVGQHKITFSEEQVRCP